MSDSDATRGEGRPEEETGAERESQEDALWQAIVENYGDRPDLTDEDLAPVGNQDPAASATPDAESGSDDVRDDPDEDLSSDRFMPPNPPALPWPEPAVLLAWVGVLGAPLCLLAVVVFSIAVPVFLSALLVIWFLGGFGYLVSAMPSGPRDPWDDGAQV
ncbi:MAG: hypothetical protein QM714_05970 [Nocardioides sp.]|uniref:hypothetical protein n=1 Tax=Nocardioides sp. TaxID=35761 RepID=UPI0039E5D410